MECYYFGCWSKDRRGHFLYNRTGATVRDSAIPFSINILDAGLLPDRFEQKEGINHLSVINGWTVVSMWDRSADSRPSSNSSFIVPNATLSTNEVLAIAAEVFPQIVERIRNHLKVDKI